jgi:AraC-like DNA-binding protein
MIKSNTAPSITPLTRLAHSMCVASFASQVGAPVEKAYTSIGLPVCCDDPNLWVPVRHTWAWFERASCLVDPAVGWLVGQSIGDRCLSQDLAARIEHGPTVFLGLQALIREATSESTHLEMSLRNHHDSIRLSTEYRMKSWPGYDVDQAYQLAVMVELIRFCIGRSWSPGKIGIEAKRAPGRLRDWYPGTRILTGQPCGFVEVDCRVLHQRYGDRVVCPNEPSLEKPRHLRAAVRNLIKAYMNDGPVTARKIAQLLDMSERTLFRQLRQQRSRFQLELDTARFEYAKDLIREHGLSCHQTAARVGVADAGNFSRMFRRIGGLSPSQYRNSLSA